MKFLLGGLVAAAMSMGAASASTVFATSVDDSLKGFVTDLNDRDISENALGETDGAFASVGLGGTLSFMFGTLFTDFVTITEVTFNDRSAHFESAEVFASLGAGPSVSLGVIDNQMPSATLFFTEVYDTISIVDTTPGSSPSFDGYDIDSVAVSAVPLPATAVLLIAGLGGLAALRRRSTAS